MDIYRREPSLALCDDLEAGMGEEKEAGGEGEI